MSGLTPEIAAAARDSVGAASQIASTLPVEVVGNLANSSRLAFTEALAMAVLVAAGIAVTGSVLIARFMPAYHIAIAERTKSSKTAESESNYYTNPGNF